MLARAATLLGLALVLAGVFGCSPKAQSAALTTAAVIACYPETLEGGTLAEEGHGEPMGYLEGDDVETVPEALLGPDRYDGRSDGRSDAPSN